MSVHYDTVIIGAGPAGMAAGITLQKNGVSNAVIDKCTFPRKKTCGGLITNKTLKVLMDLLEMDEKDLISKVFCDSAKEVEIFFKDKKLTRSPIERPMYFVRRESFDHFLVKKYKEIGGILYEGEKDYSADIQKKQIFLGSGEDISFDNVFIADGALSPTSKKLGIQNPNKGFCIETYMPRNSVSGPERVKIIFGIVKKGYAWCFPSGENICVGLGGVYKKKYDYKNRLDELLKQLGVSGLKTEYKGAFVPFGTVVDQSRVPDHAVLLGDAGGFVDPVYGEGIYFALSGGIEAANARVSSGIENICIKDRFANNTANFKKIIKQGNRLKKIFFSAPLMRLFKYRVKSKDFFVSFYCDKQISEYSYDYSHMSELYFDYRKKKKKLNL